MFIGLGVWQLYRADQKLILHDQFTARQAGEVIDLNGQSDLHQGFNELHWRKVKITGHFSVNHNILLDNQVVGGVAGYFVYTPFKLRQQELWVLINRGWVPLGKNREQIPDVIATAGELDISGHVKLPPRTGILLADHVVERHGSGIYRLQKLSLADVEGFTGLQFLPYVVRMEPDSVAGFSRRWQRIGSGRERNLGYAFQWFAMATAVLLIYLLINIKRVG